MRKTDEKSGKKVAKIAFFDAKLQKNGKKREEKRRFRHILANSGEFMENGEARDLSILCVMGRDGKLINVNDLAKDPEKQSQEYYVAAATNHGHIDPATGERIVDTEDIIGDCKVWMEEDGLHANFYFANDDEKADHAFAVSDNASYSIGTEWYMDGYYGADNEIDEPVGILREISMVATGNDPRAMTIDHKPTDNEAQRREQTENGKNIYLRMKDASMNIKLDKLTSDEANAMAEEMVGVIGKYIEADTEAKDAEDENENKANEAEGAENATEEAVKAEQDAIKSIKKRSNTYSSADGGNIVIFEKGAFGSGIKQDAAKSTTTSDWRISASAKDAFSRIAGQYRKFDSNFQAAWTAELKKHGASTNDGITGLGLPVDTRQILIDAVTAGDDDSVRILNWCEQVGGKSLTIKLLDLANAATAETSRAHGHTKGDTKIFQELMATSRVVYNQMIYKMLDLDAMEVAENPELVEFRAKELVRSLLAEYARSIVIGDGRTAPANGQPDYRTFDGTRGFYSILADATATNGIGSLMASSVSIATGKNLYDASIEASSEIEASGALMYIAKKSIVKAYRQATKANGDYVVAPGASVEASLGAAELVTPKWMDYSTVDVVVLARNAYKLIGETNATLRPDFDVRTNQNILLAEAPRGGSLGEKKSAVAITFATTSSTSGKD